MTPRWFVIAEGDATCNHNRNLAWVQLPGVFVEYRCKDCGRVIWGMVRENIPPRTHVEKWPAE